MNYRLKKILNGNATRATSYPPIDLSAQTPGIELGMEVALTLFEQIEQPLAKNQEPDQFYDSVRNITRTEALLVINSVGGETRIDFSHFDIDNKVIAEVCKKEGFYSKLAGIRFTHYYQVGSEDLIDAVPNGHPPLRSLLAVPTHWQDGTTGCLAVVNRIGEEAFGQKDAMILSLASMIFSFVRKYGSTKERPVKD